MATIVTKNSSTASAVPTTSDLVQGELAVNVTDKRIFTENASTEIVELGTNPSSITTATANVTGTLTANGTFASSNAVITGGSINSTPIGASTPSTIVGSTITANTGFIGGLTGNVTGNVTGNLTGNVTGDLTGNVVGNVIAVTGTTTLNNLVVNGTADFTATKLVNVSTPTAGTDAANKSYVDDTVAAVIDSAPAALDTLNELAAALGDDANFSSTITTSIATKLPLAGGTMTGAIAMGTSKITGLGDPTAAQDAATKAYVDTQDGTKLSLTGGTMSGAVAMGTNKITGLGDPTLAQDAATKAYTDSILGSATSAADSAAAAATSASNAATSASNAASSATASASSASASASSAAAASTSETNAAASETAAAGSETAAAASEAAAAASETAAATSASNAAASESAAATSETNAAASATSASTSASNAATSETNAAGSATSAASSATAASGSASASASSAAAAASTYDDFDDRYLGQKASDPTLDNDGDPLLTGALYFNTTSDVMKVYTGSIWQNVAPVATSITVSQISDYTGTATELNYTDGVTSPIQTQLDAKPNNLTDLGITATSTELNYTDGVTSNIQTQLDAKPDDLTDLGVTATSTELNYVDGVTSNIQTQIDNIDALPSQTGNDGLFLTTDGATASWAEAGGGAMELISTITTTTEVSTIDITSGFSSAYDNYVVVFSDFESASVRLRFYRSGSLVSSSTYDYVYMSTSFLNQDDKTYAPVNGNSGTIELYSINSGLFGEFPIFSNNSASYMIRSSASPDANGAIVIGSERSSSNPVTGIRIYAGSGTFAVGSKVSLYRIKQ